ncbi:hypothetical protein [Streptomyces sp. NBC_01304]|uniref:hypothetical protein n=1 Tax=Streptomyces sp. NBC_01304 TaxID=2903818 RepID=UPI002E10A6B9|nr:hypothetical protein OG430_00895 [Streptomyces sp. NBC_01304]
MDGEDSGVAVVVDWYAVSELGSLLSYALPPAPPGREYPNPFTTLPGGAPG